MAGTNPTKLTYEVNRVIEPFYTGGDVAISQDGNLLVACLGEDATLTDPTSGQHLARIDGDGSSITSLCLTKDASHLILCSRSLSMRIYALNRNPDTASVTITLSRSFKPHTSPVVTSALDKSGTLLATGASDGTIKVWDIHRGFATHTFHGHSGVISALHFFNPKGQIDNYHLAAGNEEGRIRIWNLQTRKCVANLDSHVSVVRGLDYNQETNVLLSASRDKTMMLWDSTRWKVKSTIPVLEPIEAGGFLTSKIVFAGGESGRLRLWNVVSAEELSPEIDNIESEILQAIHHPQLSYVVTIHSDHTLIFHSTHNIAKADLEIATLPIVRRISGTHDEIIDMAPVGGEQNPSLVIATNTEAVKIISLESETAGRNGQYFGSDIGILKGHEDIVICLDVDWSGHWIATGAKDDTARIWRLDCQTQSYSCHAVFTGHAESLSAISLPRKFPSPDSNSHKQPLSHPPSFLITVSQDKTVKRWDVPSNQADDHTLNRAIYTRKAHDKDINALDVNYNDTLFASASQDRTVKIWSLDDGEAVGILRGHKRGVWSAKFAPLGTPQINTENGQMSAARGLILTGSGDKTVKLWSLNDYTCIRTFEGHTNSVLKVIWLPKSVVDPNDEETSNDHSQKQGTRVASAGGDGLVKVWDVSSGELGSTLDNHTDRVWALAIAPYRSQLISGGGDGLINFWSDTTSITAAAAAEEMNVRVEQDQVLQNHIRAGSYREAITLALALNHPGRLLSLFTSVTSKWPPESSSLCGVKAVDEVLRNLDDLQLLTLFARIRDWNTNAKTAPIAQRILWTLLRSYSPKRLMSLTRVRQHDVDISGDSNGLREKPKKQEEAGIKQILNVLSVYTDRHYGRMEDLIDESYLVEYTLKEMDNTGLSLSINESAIA